MSRSTPEKSNKSPFRHNLTVTSVALSQLKPFGRQVRAHGKKQIKKLARSVDQFGFVLPIVIDRSKRVVAGAALVEAARLLELNEIPAVTVTDLNEAELRTLRIALNRLSEEGEWSEPELAIELQEIMELDVTFDVTITGFEMAEIDTMIDAQSAGTPYNEADTLPDIDQSGSTITQPGDLWQLGEHRLLCADATDASSFRILLEGDLAQMVFTDPPYNVPIDGHVCGLGAVKHAEFAMASGEMSELEFADLLREVLGHLATYSVDGAIHYVCMDWRHLLDLLAVGREVYSELKNICVWNKTNGGMGSLYRSKHEMVAVFKRGQAPHVNNVELGAHGRYRTNVWDYAGANALGGDRNDALAMHPTVKPVALVADAIKDCSRRGDIVLDAFSGSGTTIIAAETTGRRGFAIELDPKYVDVAIKRWQNLTGDHAVHVRSGFTFDELI
jgi:DNA modification methylase